MSGLQSIDGLASNLNTTEIIDALIEFERRPVTLMEVQQALKTQELSTFNALSAKLLALQTSITTLTNERGFSQASISVSHTDLLDASAEKALGTGSYALNILSLASNHQIASHGFDDPSQSFGTGTITLALGSRSATTITIDAGNNTLVGIKNAINDAKMGITAAIINDGSGSKPYRLVLTGNETGRTNTIKVTGSLAGGETLDFTTSVFDAPEAIVTSSLTTSQISLGDTASFTGTTNKTYTFTVKGAGAQTVGQGNVTIEWSDGTASGSIVVSQADTEIVGPDGLKLSFADGILTAGDVFQVNTFAPVLQQASDARVSIGSSANGASPLVVSSATNTIKDLIPGLTINLKGVTTTTTGPVTIKTGLNTTGVVDKIQSFITAYNDVKEFIDNQNKFNSDTKESGVLLGDLTLMTIQTRLTSLISEPVKGLDKEMNTLSAIGIRTGTDGKLTLRDSTRLTQALEKNFDQVLRLFTDGGASSNEAISFLSSTANIKGGSEFAVDITQAATHGYFQGQKIADPAVTPLTLSAANNRIKLRVDGLVSEEITLPAGTYASGEDLAAELQALISADAKIGAKGVTVEWVDLGGEGYLKLTSSGYGTASKVEIITSITSPAYNALGLTAGVAHAGDDVAGTINGEKATGKGQVLTGNQGNATTAGLKLTIALTDDQLADGAEGNITITRGFASTMRDALDRLTKSSDGVIARKTGGLQKQIDNIKNQIKQFDARLAMRREYLAKQWSDMETVLSQFQTEGAFLSSQLENITANFSQILGKKE